MCLQTINFALPLYCYITVGVIWLSLAWHWVSSPIQPQLPIPGSTYEEEAGGDPFKGEAKTAHVGGSQVLIGIKRECS